MRPSILTILVLFFTLLNGRVFAQEAKPERQPKYVLKGHRGMVWALAFSTDGKTLASGADDPMLCFWNVDTGELKQRVRGDRRRVLCIAFSRGGMLASGGEDKTIRIWDAEGRLLAGWEASKAGPVASIAFAPDGAILAHSGADLLPGANLMQEIKVWNISSRELNGRLQLGPTGYGTKSIAYSPDGSILAAGRMNGIVSLWQSDTGTPIGTLRANQGKVRAIAFSHDGSLLATGGSDGTAKVWEVKTDKLRQTLPARRDWVFSVALSPDDKFLATASNDGMVILWDLENHQLKNTYPGDWSLAFSPDGKYLATGSKDGTIRIWDLKP